MTSACCQPSVSPNAKTLSIPEGTEKIEVGMFQNERYKRVIIPASVTDIGDHAFCRWRSLKEVVFAEGSKLQRIGYGAFWETGLYRFIAPPALRVISALAFSACRSLSYVELNEGLQVLGDSVASEGESTILGAFQLSGVVQVKFPSTLKRREANTFLGCTRLRELQLPDGLEVIGPMCFSMNRFHQVAIPDSVVEIGEGAFCECKHLITVTFGKDSQLQKIGDGCFNNTNLRETVLPKGVRKVGNEAFDQTKKNYVYVPGDCTMGDAELMTRILPQEGVLIGQKTLQELREIRIIELPDGLEKVGSCWFCASVVRKVTIPATVTTIGSHAFRWCRTLSEVIFQQGSRLETVEGSAFWGCEGLRGINLPPTTKTLGEQCFMDSGLKTFTVPPYVTELMPETFAFCEIMDTIQLNEGLQKIGDRCFYKNGLDEITTPSTLREIGNMAFRLCAYMTKAVLNEGLLALGEGAFYLTRIGAMVVPSTLRKLEDSTFCFCMELANVTLYEGIEEIGKNCFTGTKIEQFIVPRSVKVIKSEAFSKCKSLKILQFGQGSLLQEIGDRAFSGTSLKKRDVAYPGTASVSRTAFI